MSITVFVKTAAGTHDVQLSGKDTIRSLYLKASLAAGVAEGNFKLTWEGSVLDRLYGGEVQSSGLVDGSEAQLVQHTATIGLAELWENPEEAKNRLQDLPEMVLEIDVGDTPDEIITLESHDLPVGLDHLIIIDSACIPRVTSGGFLQNCLLLSVTVRMTLVMFGEEFLCDCPRLVSVDFDGLKGVAEIGDYFMNGNKSLTSIDGLRGLDGVESIGDGFVCHNPSLTSVDLQSMVSSVERIGDEFLCGNASLERIDLSCFTKVETIGHHFLNNTSLKSLGLDGLTSVRSVGTEFVCNNRFLERFSTGAGGLGDLVEIDDEFLVKNSSLATVDLSGLRKTQSIGAFCLYGSPCLKSLDVSGFGKVRSIGTSFLNETSLEAFDFSVFRKVRSIGICFMSANNDLVSFAGGGCLANLTSLNDEFLCANPSLTSVDLEGFTSVTTIGCRFLHKNPSLTSIRTVGNHFACEIASTGCVSVRWLNVEPVGVLRKRTTPHDAAATPAAAGGGGGGGEGGNLESKPPLERTRKETGKGWCGIPLTLCVFSTVSSVVVVVVFLLGRR
eukprot:TRINITY_DN964_c1_g2_i1.p1 TRINITY_DN964_c1_g2~~TRINITY_DN964_c1_g2_i1.p1  ORF type:complete len:558 (+),score=88.32 TRINITY_DN964_c1_g2_i1:84-1757(+)